MTNCRMRACLVLCVAAALVGAARAECDACLEGSCYRKHSLLESEKFGLFVDIDRSRNILYSSNGFTLKQCQLDTSMCYTTTLHNGSVYWLTMDQRTGDYYGILLDGYYSLYKLDLVNKDKTLLVHEVFRIQFKDKLYYVPYNDGIYTFENGESRVVGGTEGYDVYYFIVDKNDNIYFQTVTEMNILRRVSKGAVDRTIHSDSGRVLMTTEAGGNAVFINPESHAVYRDTDGQLVEFGAINAEICHNDWYINTWFQRDDNIIYQDNSLNLFHLKQDGDVSCTFSISQNTVIITETVVSPTTYNIETTTSVTPGGDTEDMSSSTPAAESTASTPDESGASPSGTPHQRTNDTGHEQQSRCSCPCPKLPNITIKVEFN